MEELDTCLYPYRARKNRHQFRVIMELTDFTGNRYLCKSWHISLKVAQEYVRSHNVLYGMPTWYKIVDKHQNLIEQG